MPSMWNEKTGLYEKISFEESCAGIESYMEKCNRAGVLWEDTPMEHARKLAIYESKLMNTREIE